MKTPKEIARKRFELFEEEINQVDVYNYDIDFTMIICLRRR